MTTAQPGGTHEFSQTVTAQPDRGFAAHTDPAELRRWEGGTKVTAVCGGFERGADFSDYPFGWASFLTQLQTFVQRGESSVVDPTP